MSDPADFSEYLFPIDQLPVREKDLQLNALKHRVWTASKAQLIERYLQMFVWVTHNAIYLDAFAGPQNEDTETSWAAKRVINVGPKWAFRRFVFCELSPAGVTKLNELAVAESNAENRPVFVLPGDSNQRLPEHLLNNPIRDKEAAFCLFDQRTQECDWETVETVARHKMGGHKVELFYFLCTGWLERTVEALNDPGAVMPKWFGHGDWEKFYAAGRTDRAHIMAHRFKHELGYKHAFSYPIFEDSRSPRVMFHMIHATDHDAAPPLMIRAYNGVDGLGPRVEQQEMEWAEELFRKLKFETDSQ